MGNTTMDKRRMTLVERVLWGLAKGVFWIGMFLFALVAWPVLLIAWIIKKIRGA